MFIPDLHTGSGYYLYIETSGPRVQGEYADIMSPPLITANNNSPIKV